MLSRPLNLSFIPLIALLSLLSIPALAFVAFTVYGRKFREKSRMRRRWALNALRLDETSDGGGKRMIIGFFHPYCNAGGGGERVLWTAIACLQREERDAVCVVYTGDVVSVSKEDMIDKVQARFGIELDSEMLLFVPLRRRYLVEDSTWPRFTLLGQSLGSVVLAYEAVSNGLIPDIWIDTMGYAFTYPLVRYLCKTPIASYTHYPTISTDMLRRVQSREAGHTNTSSVAKSSVLTYMKLLYYYIFSELYSMCLHQADVVMVNSTWTRNHIDHLLQPFRQRRQSEDQPPRRKSLLHVSAPSEMFVSSAGLRQRPGARSPDHSAFSVPELSSKDKVARVVYPPCDTDRLAALPLEMRENIILSVAQFRPEKEQHIQLRALHMFLQAEPKYRFGPGRVKLIMAGSVRNEGDEERVMKLRTLARDLGIQYSVEFAVNVPYPQLIELFGRASIGLHTMVDEHFGITVVEFMAAGLIPLVHKSAGPLLDIVVPYNNRPTGFHATNAEEFASKLGEIMRLSEEATMDLRRRARSNAVERFSVREFEKGWMDQWRLLKDVKSVQS